MKASGKLHVPVALRLGTAPPVPIKYEAAWSQGMEKFLGCPVRGLKEWK